MVTNFWERLSHGSPGKLSRVVPEGGATFNGFYLPVGVRNPTKVHFTNSTKELQVFVSMGTWEMHHNEDYWPDSFEFDPERWTDPEKARRLEKAYVPFSKGSRMCIGIKYVELRLFGRA